MRSRAVVTSILLVSVVLLSACKRKETEPRQAVVENAGLPVAPAPTPGKAKKKRPPLPPPPKEIWKEFSGDKALAHVAKLVDLGPRPSGSAALETARAYIAEQLSASGWNVQRQPFSENTPHGKVDFVNLTARFRMDPDEVPSPKTQRVIIGSHYDTKIFSTIRFVGANDGGSSTGALIELARVLALDPALAEQIELVFFDGEEAVTQFTVTDGLYGSNYYAQQLIETKRAGQFKVGIIWDMIGDKDLTITLPADTAPSLAHAFFGAAEKLGVREHFQYFATRVQDDHVPLIRAGIPSIDIIDFDYPAWHTADDTLEQLSAESLRKVGAVTLYYLRQTQAR